MTMKRSQIVRINCIFIFTIFIVCVRSLTRLDLCGSGWTVTESTTGESVPGKVPGSVYTALHEHGILPDPLYRDNDVKFAWVGLTNWTYSRTFSVSEEVVNAKQIWLICEGLDTVASVFINGKVVGQSDNMFVRSAFNVTGIVQDGDNLLVVKFYSAVGEALARAKYSAYVIPPECPNAVQNGQCHINQIRKEECSFSWDWGPSFPTQGIWKPIYIEAYNSAILRDVSAVVKKVELHWEVYVDILFDLDVVAEVKGYLNAAIADLNVTYSHEVTISPSNNRIRLTLSVPETTGVTLWWPNGYGSQQLYSLNLSFTAGSDTTQKSIKIGFRTVELVQETVSNRTEDGLTFYFRVNGVPIFLKGSNWIPADSFQERITPEKLRFLLESAANVHINTLRGGGIGVYESDEFYQLCDQLGIMVWQDIMFSVAMYPVYPEFLDSVTTEVTQQVRRLRHHPSILCWTGNNENELGLRQNWFGTANNFTLYYNNYIQLYVKVLKTIIEAEDPTREYLTSSPSDGKESERQGYVAQDPGSELYGDIHFYDYSVDLWNASNVKIPRMASEYGIQSWCNSESLASIFAPEDFNMNSPMVEHRQHHPGGNLQMVAEVGLHLNLPNSSDDRLNFIDFIYLTQINQAMSVRTQSEHYRRHQSQLLPDGRGLTMGALYWQLNDIWQAPTWSSIDYAGTWKMLHYFARSFFNKYLVSPYLRDDKTLDVFMVIDERPVKEVRLAGGQLSFQPILETSNVEERQALHRSATAGNVTISIYNYKSFSPLLSWKIPFTLKTVAESVFTKNISDLLVESGCPGVESCLLYLTATDISVSVLSTSWLPLAYPKFSRLLPAKVKISSITWTDVSLFTIEVSTDAIALFVWLSTDNVKGHFSDNGFVMLTPRTQVQFQAYQTVTVDELSSTLRVRSVVG